MFSRRLISVATTFARKVNVAQQSQIVLPCTTPVMVQPKLITSSSSVAVSIMKRSMMTLSSSIIQKKTVVPTPSSTLMNVNRMSSTMKKRRMKMNKHKLKKRRKALRMNTKASREA